MATLRIYEVGAGDCLAVIDHDGHIPLIFDTGYKSKFERAQERSKCTGFGRALYDAKIGAGANSQPPTVVISHVDRDHIGGLLHWIEDIFKNLEKPKSWAKAGEVAQQEIKEVWCNIPLNNQKLAHLLGIPLQPQNGEIGDEHNKAKDLVREWIKKNKCGDLSTDIRNIHKVEAISKTAFCPPPDPEKRSKNDEYKRDEKLIREIKRNHETKSIFDWLKERLEEAFADGKSNQDNFIDDLFDDAPTVTSIDTNKDVGHIENKPQLEISFDFTAQLATLTITLSANGQDPRLSNPRSYYRFVLSHSIEETGDDSLYHAQFADRFMLFRGAIARDSNFTAIHKLAGEINRRLSDYTTFRQVLRYSLDLARDSAVSNPDALEKITIVEAFLGLTAMQEVKTQMSVFYALGKLGIPVLGGNIDDMRNEVYSLNEKEKINGELPFRLLAPSKERLERLFDNWNDHLKDLQVKGLSLAAVMYATRAKPHTDSSIKNLSSISLWLEPVGTNATLILTGDTLYSDIYEQMEKAKKEIPSIDRPDGKRYIFQIPHHGGAYNTIVADDKLPNEVLCPGKNIACAFASGGRDKPHEDGSGPRKDVVEFYKKGAEQVIVARQEMKGEDLDIELA